MEKSVFMSIKEIHINRILKRVKNHEFRTKKPKKDFEYIIVYVPTPLKELKYVLKVNSDNNSSYIVIQCFFSSLQHNILYKLEIICL